MTKEIKQRIEQIKNGEVPQGYKKTKIGIVPNEWEVSKLNKFLKVCKEKNDELLYGKEDVFSISGEYGIVNQIKFLGRSYAGASVEAYRVVRSGDIVYTKSPLKNNPYGIIKANLKDKTGIVSTLYAVYKCNENVLPSYVQWYFGLDNILNNYLLPLVNIGAKNDMKISDENVLKGDVIFPKLFEQQKIADILSTQDKVIELKEKLLKEKEKRKKYLMQILLTGRKRLKGFNGEWKKYNFENIFRVIASNKYQIKKNEYLVEGVYPVIDQGKKEIVGYSNNEEKVLKCPQEGIIVFGDHTCCLKFIDFDFIVGADGTQLLSSKSDEFLNIFLYYYLSNKKIINDGYSRHFKYIKEFVYTLPKFEEQKAIAEILTTADKELKLLQEELEEEKRKKKALMQLLLTGIVRVKV